MSNKHVVFPKGDKYPTVIVVGACICGSWPGGKCLGCPKR